MNSKLIPAAVLAAMFAASGAVIVSAQTATTPPAAEAPVANADVFKGRGHEGGHRGHGGPDGGGLVRGVLSQADADADGAVTQAEVNAFRAAQVGAADVSGEGDLSLEEFETVYLQLIRSQIVDAFQDLDEDGDASITAAELDARLNGMVERMDRDDDGALSPADGRGRRG